jgi:hypothetical protein
MSRDDFLENLRIADRSLRTPVESWEGGHGSTGVGLLRSTDLWLTPKSVDGYQANDFSDWPKRDRDALAIAVAGFADIARTVSGDEPATKAQSKAARDHLERAIMIVRGHILPEWISAQEAMIREATEAAEAEGWFVERDEKELTESLLGTYRAPRLRIRAADREVILDPIARFGSGRRGIVDLCVMPTFETAYLIVLQNGQWRIVAPHGTLHARPFDKATLVNTISRLPR